jgi:hypothetical protein
MKLANKAASVLRYGGLAVLLFLLMPAAACPGGNDLPANLSLSNLSVTPAEVEAGQAVTISVTATNTGDSEGSFNITLIIEDQTEETKAVSIAAGGSTTVSFSVTRIQGGAYTLAIGSLRGSFNVQGVDFIADGIIAENEYTHSASFGGENEFTLYWKSDSDNIYMAMQAAAAGWISVGFQPQPEDRKDGADMVLGWVADGETFIFDLYSTGTFGPHPLDTNLDGTDDILEFGGSESGSVTTIEFKRRLNTGDGNDERIVAGTNLIIWAFGPNDDLFKGHDGDGYGEIEV